MRFFEKLVVAYFFGPPCRSNCCYTGVADFVDGDDSD